MSPTYRAECRVEKTNCQIFGPEQYAAFHIPSSLATVAKNWCASTQPEQVIQQDTLWKWLRFWIKSSQMLEDTSWPVWLWQQNFRCRKCCHVLYVDLSSSGRVVMLCMWKWVKAAGFPNFFGWDTKVQELTKGRTKARNRCVPTNVWLHVWMSCKITSHEFPHLCWGEVMHAWMPPQEEDAGRKRARVHTKHGERVFFSEPVPHVCIEIHYFCFCSLFAAQAPKTHLWTSFATECFPQPRLCMYFCG